jgi:hypothetical protein
MGQFILKRDNLKLGLILGLLMPIIGIFAFYLWKFSFTSFANFWYFLKTNKNLVTSLSVVCLFLNVLLFTLYINTKRDQTAKGVFAITVVFGIAAFIFKIWG